VAVTLEKHAAETKDVSHIKCFGLKLFQEPDSLLKKTKTMMLMMMMNQLLVEIVNENQTLMVSCL